jgi:hypothetical protein
VENNIIIQKNHAWTAPVQAYRSCWPGLTENPDKPGTATGNERTDNLLWQRQKHVKCGRFRGIRQGAARVLLGPGTGFGWGSKTAVNQAADARRYRLKKLPFLLRILGVMCYHSKLIIRLSFSELTALLSGVNWVGKRRI